MVFSDVTFLFQFLPVALIGFWIVAQAGMAPAKLWLCSASLIFYSWWNPWSVIVLCVSVMANFSMGRWMLSRSRAGKPVRPLMIGAISANLLALIYYKYLFWLLTLLGMSGAMVSSPILPLGISFFTFTQIAFLADISEGFTGRYTLTNYLLFVTFFPHLIAGPIVHHRDLMPQFEDRENYRVRPREVAVGLAIFAFGLAKKTLLADNLALTADKMLGAGHVPMPIAWIGALAYSMQLYFDFSGYSDMAIGLARMFAIRFPINFFSPYKATNIIDFWQRWHITLTRFLTAYVYNPIALALVRRRAGRGLSTGKRVSRTARGFAELIAFPTILTMGLAGIWHGSGGQFLIFGLLHGSYLTINHVWRTFGPKATLSGWSRVAADFVYMLLVYLAVLVAQMFFRAHFVDEAVRVLRDMAGLVPRSQFAAAAETPIWPKDLAFLATALGVAWLAPNAMQIMADFDPAIPLGHHFNTGRIKARLTLRWALGIGMVLGAGLQAITDSAPFIYFQF